MRILELIVGVKPNKGKEFNQTLDKLSVQLQQHCKDLKINKSDNELSYSILAQWETTDKLHEALKSKEYKILFGAIEALCEKTSILLNDKHLGNKISTLNSL